MGFSRTNGYDLSERTTIERIVSDSADCSIFINNACRDWAQIDLLYAVFAKWKPLDRLIINIGSNSGDCTKTYEHKYAAVKTALDTACNQLNQIAEAKCRVVNLRPGWVRTPRVESLNIQEPMLTTAEVAQTLSWLIDLPSHMHVPSLTMLAVR